MTARMRLLGWIVAAPAVITATSIVALEAWRASAPESPLFSAPFVYSLAEAIERDDVHAAYAFIRAGQDPDAPIAVRHTTLTAGRSVLVAPIVWAAATDAKQSALMLIGTGARLDPEAPCVAAALDHEDMAELLRRYAATAVHSCSDRADSISRRR